MKPTSDDFEPRRDGWFEHKGTWEEVTLGTVMADPNFRSKRWEVIDVAHGGVPVEDGKTLYMRVREHVSGTEATITPRQKSTKILILTQDPRDTKTAPPTEPSDTEAILLLIRELGATHLATKDNTTGEITCPDYIMNSHIPKDSTGHSTVRRGMIEHMRYAHQMSVDDDLDLVSAITLHGQAHNPQWPNIGKGGFSHRHVPEQHRDNFAKQ